LFREGRNPSAGEIEKGGRKNRDLYLSHPQLGKEGVEIESR